MWLKTILNETNSIQPQCLQTEDVEVKSNTWRNQRNRFDDGGKMSLDVPHFFTDYCGPGNEF